MIDVILFAIACGSTAVVVFYMGFRWGLRRADEKRVEALDRARVAEFARRVFEHDTLDDSAPKRLNRGAFHVN